MHIELATLLAYHMHGLDGEGCEVKGHCTEDGGAVPKNPHFIVTPCQEGLHPC